MFLTKTWLKILFTNLKIQNYFKYKELCFCLWLMEATRNNNIFQICMRKIKENNQLFNNFPNFWFFNCTSQFNREFCKLHEFQLTYTKSRKSEEQVWNCLIFYENYEKILESKYETPFGKLIFNSIYHFIQPFLLHVFGLGIFPLPLQAPL